MQNACVISPSQLPLLLLQLSTFLMYLPPSLLSPCPPPSVCCSIHLQEIKIRIFKETFSRSLRFSFSVSSSSALSHSANERGIVGR